MQNGRWPVVKVCCKAFILSESSELGNNLCLPLQIVQQVGCDQSSAPVHHGVVSGVVTTDSSWVYIVLTASNYGEDHTCWTCCQFTIYRHWLVATTPEDAIFSKKWADITTAFLRLFRGKPLLLCSTMWEWRPHSKFDSAESTETWASSIAGKFCFSNSTIAPDQFRLLTVGDCSCGLIYLG